MRVSPFAFIGPAALIVVLQIAAVALAGWVLGLMTEFSLWVIFGKQIPFLLAMLAGLFLNGLTPLVWIICLLGSLTGHPGPWFH